MLNGLSYPGTPGAIYYCLYFQCLVQCLTPMIFNGWMDGWVVERRSSASAYFNIWHFMLLHKTRVLILKLLGIHCSIKGMSWLTELIFFPKTKEGEIITIFRHFVLFFEDLLCENIEASIFHVIFTLFCEVHIVILILQMRKRKFRLYDWS